MCNSSGSMRLYEFFSTIVISLNSGTIAAYSLVSASLHLLHILCLHLRNSTDNSIQMFIELFFGHKKMDCLGRCGRIPNHKIEFAGIVQCHKVWYHEFTSLLGLSSIWFSIRESTMKNCPLSLRIITLLKTSTS